MNRRTRPRSFYFRASALGFSLLLAVAACGGGGGDGSADLVIQEEVTYLVSDDSGDVRTGFRLRFQLSNLDNPDEPLMDEAFEIRRDGVVDTEGLLEINPDAVEKSDITLLLDVSSSLSPSDLADLKTSAQEFVAELVEITDTLYIYSFSSVSRTTKLGEYSSVDDGDGDFVWSGDPAADLDTLSTGDNATALFYAVDQAVRDHLEVTNILVVFSDGKENASPENARAEVLEKLRSVGDDGMIVFTVGFGSVDSSELRALVVGPLGGFIGVKSSLTGLFSEVAREIKSFYTIVYSTPVTFGTQQFDMRIDTGSGNVRYVTEFNAGVDLAAQSYGRYPSLPGSVVVLDDMTGESPVPLTYRVLDAAVGKVGKDDVFLFQVEPEHTCTNGDCAAVYQGVFGLGAVTDGPEGPGEPPAEPQPIFYFDGSAADGEEWIGYLPDADDETVDMIGMMMRDGTEKLTLLSGTPGKRKIVCARVTSEFGTYWFAPGIGLVRMRNADGDLVLELGEVPCLPPTFGADCIAE
jgi:hypothetical protein